MTAMSDYQDWVKSVSWYKGAGENTTQELVYLILGLAGEAGEAADVVKKTVRTHGIPQTEDLNVVLADTGRRGKFIDELGDVTWYLAGLLNVLGMTFEELTELNKAKLIARQEKTK